MSFLTRADALAAGDHACLVYDDDGRRDEMLLSFLKAGLERGERLMYLADGADTRIGPEFVPAVESGQLTVIPSWDDYVAEDRIDFDRLYNDWRAATEQARAAGFPALRAAGAPPEFAIRNGHSHEVCDYERRANELFADDGMVAICAYDARKASPGALYGVIDAHPIVLYAVRPDPRLRVEGCNGRLVVRGWLDTTTFGAFIGVLEEAVSDSSDDLEIDLGGIEFVDIAGLRLLVEAAERLHDEGRTLTVHAAPEWVPTVLGVLGYADRPGLVLQ